MRRLLLAVAALSFACAPAPLPRLPPPAPAPPLPALALVSPPANVGPQPPVAAKHPKTDVLFGKTRIDDYYWLRQKDTPEVISYLQAENAYTEAMTARTAPFQDALYKEMLARIKETDISVPVRRGAWLYYDRTEQGKQYKIYCRKKAERADAPEVVLLDLNEIAEAAKFVGLGAMEVSDDGNELAFAVDTTGFRQYTLEFKDLRSGAISPERIARVDAVAFARDNRTVLYVTENEITKRPNRLYRHVVGQDAAKDPLVYDEKDELFELDAHRSRSRDYIFVTSASQTTSEVRVLPAAKPLADLKVISPREAGHEYYVDHAGGLFYIRTNSGGRNFRIVTAPVADARREKWKEIVPHRGDVMLEDIELFADHYVLLEREDALPRIDITSLRSGKTQRVELRDAVYALFAEEEPHELNPEFTSHQYRFEYESPDTPPSIFDFDVVSGDRKLLKQEEVLGGFDTANYETLRVHATARDGAKIPLSLLFRKGTRPDGTHPLYLTAYGSYGSPMSDYFTSERMSLVDRGLVVAIAHIRGGGDLGKKWHDQGRMMNKMNTFTDFIDSAEYLVREGWANRDHIGIEGASAGGLLMGAVTNLRPDLWKAVIARVPFVDVINTMLDESLPLTVTEFEEWGNPKVKEQYDYMMRYSPYDNVAPKAYPAMLVMTSYNDSQVMYWEPAKYVAKLRATKTDRHPLLFKTNMDPAGHGGLSGRYDHLHEIAFKYAFLLDALGIGR